MNHESHGENESIYVESGANLLLVTNGRCGTSPRSAASTDSLSVEAFPAGCFCAGGHLWTRRRAFPLTSPLIA